MNPCYPKRSSSGEEVPNMLHHSYFIPILNMFQTQAPVLFGEANLIPSNLNSSSATFQTLPQKFNGFDYFLRKYKDVGLEYLDNISIDWMSWTLPEKERYLAVQHLILAVILSINGAQSVKESLPAINGIPEYLTGSFHARNWRMERIWAWRLAGTAEQKTSLLDWLTERPFNSSKAALIRMIEVSTQFTNMGTLTFSVTKSNN